MSRQLKKLKKALVHADSYATWRAIADEHDALSGAAEWKTRDPSFHYDYELIRNRLAHIRQARERQDIRRLVFHLHEGLHGNLGNISNPALYSVALVGTKNLVQEYLDEVTDTLRYLCDTDFTAQGFTLSQKKEFFRNTAQAFGRSALMLSGGAALGLFHIGVTKTLWQEGLLPDVISGSSAGSIIAAVIGTHSDSELLEKLQPENIYLTAFRVVDWAGLLRGKPVLDGDYLETCLEENIFDMTFEEAYRHTGREINITVSPYERHQHSRLLNWRTSPNVLVRKASLASCAIPGIYKPVTLWAKNVDGERVPYIPSRKWVDGSIKDDLPIMRLARLYGINHSIVSQTNPHVVPFIARKGDGRLMAAAGNLALRNLSMNARFALNLLQRQVESNELGLMLDKAASILQQKYIGDINIIPPRRPSNILRMLKNPTVQDVRDFIERGERATWPLVEYIRNTTAISRTFRDCIKTLDSNLATVTELTRPA